MSDYIKKRDREGYAFTPQHRANISKARLQMLKDDPEFKAGLVDKAYLMGKAERTEERTEKWRESFQYYIDHGFTTEHLESLSESAFKRFASMTTDELIAHGQKITEGKTGKPDSKQLSASARRNISKSLQGKVSSEEAYVSSGIGCSDSFKDGIRRKFECPNCNRFFWAGMFSRWHGDNCQMKYSGPQLGEDTRADWPFVMYQLTDINGNTYDVMDTDLPQFCNNNELTLRLLMEVMRGKRKHHRGFTIINLGRITDE